MTLPHSEQRRCDATIDWGKAAGHQCENRATWSVLMTVAEREVCGVHARVLRVHPLTLAMEPLEEGVSSC